MDYKEELAAYRPQNEQEAAGLALVRQMADRFGDEVLWRDCLAGHLTGSGIIVNETRDKTLMIYHNIYKSWSWTGGHADGERDLLAVALREAREETGVTLIEPLTPVLASVDVLNVKAHQKHGKPVSAHLHLSFAYLLVAPEEQALTVKPDENSAVRWIPAGRVGACSTEPEMVMLYERLLRKAGALPCG